MECNLAESLEFSECSDDFGRPRILVLGCGGAGNNTVSLLVKMGITVNMPGMDGLEATVRIREVERQNNPPSHIPIVALTGGIMPDEQRKCYEAGMDEIIAKPLSMENLSSVFKNNLSHLIH